MLPDLPQPELMELYRVMLTMRRFEEALILATKSGVSVGHFHVYIGQECTGAPALSLLRPDDTIFTTHRNHGHVLARGADPGRVLAEIMGRATGYNSGKGGTLHITARELGVLPTSAVVGGVVPLATGAAFAAKQKGSDAVCMCFFGDGALEEGAFYEAINLASLWTLPVIYLCENNSEGAIAGGKYDMIVLDEINVAVDLKLLKASDVLSALKQSPEKMIFIFTGRGAPKSFIKKADLVTEMREVKHPFNKKKCARLGVEF